MLDPVTLEIYRLSCQEASSSCEMSYSAMATGHRMFVLGFQNHTEVLNTPSILITHLVACGEMLQFVRQ